MRGDAHPEVGEGERAVRLVDHVEHQVDLALDLVRHGEHVAVVLREAAHAREARQFPALLIAVVRGRAGPAHRQLAVRVRVLLVEHHEVRAVHRLQVVRVLVLQLHGRIHRVVLLQVARDLVQAALGDVRDPDGDVSAGLLALDDEVLHQASQHGAARIEQRKPAADLVDDREQLELLAKLAMVALLGFLHHGEVRDEFLLRLEREAIDARELVVLLAPAPVRAGEDVELERFRVDVRERVGMAAAAKVDVRSRPVQRQRLSFRRELVDELRLVLVVRERRARLVGRDFGAIERREGWEQLAHLRLDLRQILFRDGRRELEIVIEPVVDGRADGALGVRVQLEDCRGEQVGKRMAEVGELFGRHRV